MKGKGKDMKKTNRDIFQAIVSPSGMRIAACVAMIMLTVLIVMEHSGTGIHMMSFVMPSK